MQVICKACGYRGPKRQYGCLQIFLMLFLLLLGIIPGLIYAVYVESYNKRCPKCDQRTLIPADSPNAA